MMSNIKYRRAQRASRIGDCHGSFDAMYDRLPDSVVAALSSARLAGMIDAMWVACQEAKRIAESDVIENGFVWDSRRNRSVDLQPAHP